MRDIKAYYLEEDNGRLDIHIMGVIGWDVLAKDVIADIKFWSAKSVHFTIHSGGGAVFEAFAIRDYIKASGIECTAEVFGICASAATVIASAASEVQMGENSFWMIHNSTTWDGKRDKTTRKIDEKLNSIYRDLTGLSKRRVAKLMDEETFFTAEEATDYGFVNGTVKELAFAAIIEGYLSTNNMSDNQEANTPNIEENKTLLAKVATALGLKEAEDTSKEVEHDDKEADEILASMSEDLKAKTTALDEMGGELENVKAELGKKEAAIEELKAEKESISEDYAAKLEGAETERDELKAKVEEQEAIIAKLKNEPIPSEIKAEATEVQDPGATSKPKKAARKIMTDKQEAFIEAQKARRERNK